MTVAGRWGIIGSAGRSQDSKLVNLRPQLYHSMVGLAHQIVGNSELVSGGAAWADHVAVTLCLQEGNPLRLHLPAPFIPRRGFEGGSGTDGGTSNYHHQRFSRIMGSDPHASLKQIEQAIGLDRCTVVGSSGGFKARNLTVAAESLHLLVFKPLARLTGGTAHTVRAWKRMGLLGRLVVVNMNTGDTFDRN